MEGRALPCTGNSLNKGVQGRVSSPQRRETLCPSDTDPHHWREESAWGGGARKQHIQPHPGNTLEARCLYIILYPKEKRKRVGEGEKSFASPAQPSPALSRGGFIHLRACQCDIVSALPRAIHLTFKLSNCLGPPADPSVPSDLLAREAHSPPRLPEGRWHLPGSPSLS